MLHLSRYGTACMFSGQLDAGECYICYAKRKKMEVEKLRDMLRELGVSEEELYEAKKWSKDNRFQVTHTSQGDQI